MSSHHQFRLRWPEGRLGALTTSWDDGTVQDRRLVGILNRFGIKGTFNLNSGHFDGRPDTHTYGRLPADEIREVYVGHEIAIHTENHPWLDLLPVEGVVAEIMANRSRLEEIAGYPVYGMALPYGTYNAGVSRALAACGVRHCRTGVSTGRLDVPENFLEWHPSCHHKNPELPGLLQKLVEEKQRPRLLYVWGHSFEFEKDDNWELIDDFAGRVGAATNLWLATNREVMDYCLAARGLRWSADGKLAENPSATPVWFEDAAGVKVVAAGTVTAFPGDIL